jgi:CRP-like cAMP-binding protein
MFRELYQQHRAKRILKDMFVVQYVRYIKVKHVREQRAAWTKERLSKMHKPTVESLRKNEIFEKLPEDNLRAMIDSMTAACFKKGEIITHEGDWGTDMWFLDRGLVEIRIRVMTGKTKLKSRGIHNTVVVSQLDQPGSTFGEFALLTKEPRVATFACVKDTDTWVLGKPAFEKAMEKLPADTFEVLQRKADERRQLNMAKLYGMNESTLRHACKFIDGWSSRGVQKILRRLEPKIFRKGDYIFREGDSAEGIYILVVGKLR